MIGILGGMGTQAGLDLCNKLAMLYRGKSDQKYPQFILYNKSDTPNRPANIKEYSNVLRELTKGCKLLQKNKCKFIVVPCNTAHYWYDDLKKKVKIPILSMPEEAYLYTKKNCKPDSKIGLLSTEATIKTKVYNKYFNNNFNLVHPTKTVQKKYVNSAIKLVKQGKVKEASKAIQPAITYFKRIKSMKLRNPQIIGFNETGQTSEQDVYDVLNTALGGTWYVLKHDPENITASRFPILDSWDVHNKIQACLIDLDDEGPDMLFIVGHLNCCGADNLRQEQVDRFTEFILDAKIPGGEITVPENTPIVFLGDINLVGYSQQYYTIIEGDIQDTDSYGQGGFPDWDNSELEDVICRQTDKRI